MPADQNVIMNRIDFIKTIALAAVSAPTLVKACVSVGIADVSRLATFDSFEIREMPGGGHCRQLWHTVTCSKGYKWTWCDILEDNPTDRRKQHYVDGLVRHLERLIKMGHIAAKDIEASADGRNAKWHRVN